MEFKIKLNYFFSFRPERQGVESYGPVIFVDLQESIKVADLVNSKNKLQDTRAENTLERNAVSSYTAQLPASGSPDLPQFKMPRFLFLASV